MKKLFLLVVALVAMIALTGCDALANPIAGRVKVDGHVAWEPEAPATAPTTAVQPLVSAPSPTPQAGVAPTATTATSAVHTGAPIGLKYQFDQGCSVTSTPYDYPACIIQNVQSGERTVEDAVRAIQALGQKFGAPSFEGMTLSLPNLQPAVVWCPSGAEYPPDTARPLEGTKGSQWASNLVVVNRGTGGPDRLIEAFSTACWMVYVK